MSLIEEATFITKAGSPRHLYELLSKCLSVDGVEALAAVQILAQDMYGGFTYNREMKAPAACCLLAWGMQGLRAIAEIPKRNPEFTNYTIVIQLLAQVAAGMYPHFEKLMPEELQQKLRMRLPPIGDFAREAEAALNELILALPGEDDATFYAGHTLQMMAFLQDVAPVRNLISSVALRWLVVGVPVVEEYERLLRASPDDERALQKFLEQHPLLLDPLAMRVWPKPDLHGKKEPDFLLQRVDGTYLVIEIETPAKGLITDANQLSAKATQAVTQALEYREFLLARFESASRTFPDFRTPDALVVIGREDVLDDARRAALRRENEGRSYLKLVGFDTLATRARAMLKNLTEGRVQVESVRLA